METTSQPETEERLLTREELMTADEVAALLCVRRTTALDYMRRGLIPGFKLGRRWYARRSRLSTHLASVSADGGAAE
jgi:excisionase family DNA binding protein